MVVYPNLHIYWDFGKIVALDYKSKYSKKARIYGYTKYTKHFARNSQKHF